MDLEQIDYFLEQLQAEIKICQFKCKKYFYSVEQEYIEYNEAKELELLLWSDAVLELFNFLKSERDKLICE